MAKKTYNGVEYDDSLDYSVEIEKAKSQGLDTTALEQAREAKIGGKYGGNEPTMYGSNQTYKQATSSGNTSAVSNAVNLYNQYSGTTADPYAGTDFHQDAINAAMGGDWDAVIEALNKREEKVMAQGDNRGKTSAQIYAELMNLYGQKTPQYSSQIDSLLNAILNREPFSYDHTTDPTYLAYEDKYKRLGDRAREDTLGDVAGLTGGRPSSWAVSAASQAQNDYNQQLSDVIPTLYDAAYNRYLNEDSLKRSDLGLIMDVDNMKYGRYRDTVADSKWQKEFDLSEDQFDWSKDTWQQEFDLSKDKFDYTKDIDEHNRLMDKWKTMGVADEEVAKGLGVPVDSTTESYEFNKLDAERAAANDQFDRDVYDAEMEQAKADKTAAETEQKYLEGPAYRTAMSFLEDGRPDDAAEAILAAGMTSAADYYRIGEELGIKTSILDRVFDQFYIDALKGDPVVETRTKTSWKNAALGSEDPLKFLQDNAALIDADGVDWGALYEEVMNLQDLIN